MNCYHKLLASILPVATALLLSAGLAGAAPAAKPAQNQQFRAIYPTEPKTLDPHQNDPAAWPVIMATYGRLMTLKEGTAQPAPALVQFVRVSTNGLKYTFQLAEGLTFSDGIPLDSQAVLYSFDRLMASEVGRRYYPYLTSFEPKGDYSFQLILSRPWPPFLASLALPAASLISPGLRDRPADYLRTRTLGSGSYQVYDWQNHTLGLQVRPDRVAKPRVAQALFHYEPDPGRRYEKMTAHSAHLAVDPARPQSGLPPNFQMKQVPTFGARYLAFNTRKVYLSRPEVRRAMARIISESMKGHPPLAAGLFPPGLFYNAPAGLSAPIEAAEEPLRAIGWPDDPLILAHPAADPALAALAGEVAAALTAAGRPAAVAPRAGEPGDYDLWLDARFPEIPAADMWLGRFLDSTSSPEGNPAFFRNRRADQLIGEIAATIGQPDDGPREVERLETVRAAKLAALVALARDEAPYVFLEPIERPLVIDVRLAKTMPHPAWPEVWPLDQVDLKPFSFRSGANPTGRPPAAAQPEPGPQEPPQ